MAVRRPAPATLSLGVETISMLAALARTWTNVDGSNARSRSEVVRDLVARAYAGARRKKPARIRI